jgi:Protein of unknown function (DUF1573)
MKHCLALLLGSWMILATQALSQPVLDMPLEIDWGTVAPQANVALVTKVERDITIRNAGNQPLRIHEVRPSCGCTTAPLDTNLLAPGEQTTMHVSLNLPSVNGPIKKYVTIRTNAGPDSVKLLTLKADVQRALQMESSYFGFNKAEQGKPTVAEIVFTSYADDDVFVKPKALPAGLRVVGDSPLVLKKGVKTALRVEYIPEVAGVFNIQTVFTTSLQGYEELSLQGFGMADRPSAQQR